MESVDKRIAGYERQRDTILREAGNDHLTRQLDAANLTAMCDRLRNPDQLRRSHVAHPAPNGVTSAKTLIATG
jgi:hypothetical protein